MTDTFAVLDPRLNYKKLCKDYAGDPELSQYLEKQELWIYFDVHYPASVSSKTATTRTTTGSESSHRPINFDDDGSDDDVTN
jgi:hypothetical protein